MKTDPRDVPSRDILGPVLTWRQTNLLPELEYCFLSYLVLYLCVYPPKTVWVEYLVNLACHRVVDGQEEKQIISMEQQNPCTFPPHFRSSSPCQRYIMNRGLISHDIPSSIHLYAGLTCHLSNCRPTYDGYVSNLQMVWECKGSQDDVVTLTD